MTHTTRAAAVSKVIASSVLAAALLAGCTGDEEPTSSPSGSSNTENSTPDPSPTDQSKEVLEKAATAEPAVTTTGKLTSSPTLTERTVSDIPATIGVYSVVTSEAGTVLDWEISSTDAKARLTTLSDGSTITKVRLLDPQSKKYYEVLSTTSPADRPLGGDFPTELGGTTLRMSMAFPPLPSSVTSVQLVAPNFANATVAVTR